MSEGICCSKRLFYLSCVHRAGLPVLRHDGPRLDKRCGIKAQKSSFVKSEIKIEKQYQYLSNTYFIFLVGDTAHSSRKGMHKMTRASTELYQVHALPFEEAYPNPTTSKRNICRLCYTSLLAHTHRRIIDDNKIESLLLFVIDAPKGAYPE